MNKQAVSPFNLAALVIGSAADWISRGGRRAAVRTEGSRFPRSAGDRERRRRSLRSARRLVAVP